MTSDEMQKFRWIPQTGPVVYSNWIFFQRATSNGLEIDRIAADRRLCSMLFGDIFAFRCFHLIYAQDDVLWRRYEGAEEIYSFYCSTRFLSDLSPSGEKCIEFQGKKLSRS